MSVSVEAKVAALEARMDAVQADIRRVEAIATSNQATLRWAMGAAAAAGALVPMILRGMGVVS